VGLALQEFDVVKFLVSRSKVVVSRRRPTGAAWLKRTRIRYWTRQVHRTTAPEDREQSWLSPLLLRPVGWLQGCSSGKSAPSWQSLM